MYIFVLWPPSCWYIETVRMCWSLRSCRRGKHKCTYRVLLDATIYIRMHTYMHTYIHPYMHTYTLTCIHVYKSYIYIHTYTHMYIHTYTLEVVQWIKDARVVKLNVSTAGFKQHQLMPNNTQNQCKISRPQMIHKINAKQSK